MNVFEVGVIFGVIGGAVVGAVVCKSHGTLAEVGGAVGGGIVGIFAGILYGYLICAICGIAMGLWQTITGRHKKPNPAGQDLHDHDKAA
jgi:hypothetical protein